MNPPRLRRSASLTPATATACFAAALALTAATGCGDDGQVQAAADTADAAAAPDADGVTPADTGAPAGCAGAPDGRACDDGDPCTTSDRCDGGVCVGGDSLACSDPSPCRAGRCEPGVGCVFSDLDDGEACTLSCFTAATCKSGRCEPALGSAKPCPDSSDPCVDRWSCDSATGTCSIPIFAPTGSPCDLDDDVCSLDRCDGDGACVASGALDTCAQQSQNNPCWTYTCVKKTGCTRTSFVLGASCDDLNPCTLSDTCKLLPSGQEGCLGTPFDIDDKNPCTDDACLAGAVTHTPIDGIVCTTPLDLCDGVGLCQAGLCNTSPVVQCDDHDPCTLDRCDPATGACLHDPAPDGGACDDQDACTTLDRCAAGACKGLTLGNCCGNGYCEAGETCGCDADCHGQPCDAPDACTDNATCQGGLCLGELVPACCGNGLCEPGETCACAADCQGQPCAAADACVTAATCQPDGACGGGQPLAVCCGDGVCSASELCDCALDCAGEGCDDGDPATNDDLCQSNGTCAGVACPAGNEGAYAPTASGTLSGTHVYTSLHIPSGVVIRGAGTAPLDITVCGDAVIAGTLSVSGGDGQFSWSVNATNGNPSGAPGGAGGTACCGGGIGGTGGHSPASSGATGGGTQGGRSGTTVNSGVYKNGGNAGGGGHATAGTRGFQNTYTGTAGAGGGTYGTAQLDPPTGGSGGGGGSAGVGGASTGYGGAGGGGGGGILRLEAYGELAIAAGGAIRADGGKAGRCQDSGAVGDGGTGAGGAVHLRAPTVTNHGEVTARGGVACGMNGATENDGRGGEGRVRVDTAGAVAPTGTFIPAPGFVGTY